MDKISATTAHSSSHQPSSVEKAHQSAQKDAEAQATKRSEEAERAKTVIDSRPSQAHLNFQQSLYATHGASDGRNS